MAFSYPYWVLTDKLAISHEDATLRAKLQVYLWDFVHSPMRAEFFAHVQTYTTGALSLFVQDCLSNSVLCGVTFPVCESGVPFPKQLFARQLGESLSPISAVSVYRLDSPYPSRGGDRIFRERYAKGLSTAVRVLGGNFQALQFVAAFIRDEPVTADDGSHISTMCPVGSPKWITEFQPELKNTVFTHRETTTKEGQFIGRWKDVNARVKTRSRFSLLTDRAVIRDCSRVHVPYPERALSHFERARLESLIGNRPSNYAKLIVCIELQVPVRYKWIVKHFDFTSQWFAMTDSLKRNPTFSQLMGGVCLSLHGSYYRGSWNLKKVRHMEVTVVLLHPNIQPLCTFYFML